MTKPKPRKKRKDSWVWEVIWGISGKWRKTDHGFEAVGIIPPDQFRWSEYNAFFVTMMLGRLGTKNGKDLYPDIIHIAEDFSYRSNLMRAHARYAHYLALYNAVPKKKRYMMKAPPKSKVWSENQIKAVADLFQLNDDRAIEYLEDMGKEQADRIVNYYEEIGRL